MAIAALSRMMATSSPVRSSKRRLLGEVAVSILRYGNPVRASALWMERNAKLLESTHRLMCLRVISAYRTVSGDAASVVACMMPIGLLIMEDAGGKRNGTAHPRAGWIDRPHGEVNFGLTQFLTGHGCFRWQVGHTASPVCPGCPNELETAEHVLFAVPVLRHKGMVYWM
ncbi:uncharacterized protein LOC131439161 [Malaya genurostris]|uniref:uncharacterized protein LOC131439161 n=1 Tax=Malaya genurostris TaxID=325434 RepID=UPI0026F3A5E1|nr:uncharacterized protein LOC131439161 [Malaya genurostris]